MSALVDTRSSGDLARAGDTSAALALARQAADRAPDSAIVQLNLADRLAAQEEWREALSSYRKAGELARTVRPELQDDDLLPRSVTGVALTQHHLETHGRTVTDFATELSHGAAPVCLRNGKWVPRPRCASAAAHRKLELWTEQVERNRNRCGGSVSRPALLCGGRRRSVADQKPADSLTPGYFDQVYAANSDPWNFAESEYEREKYADTLAHLPRERYPTALEVGCSIGVLTAQLAGRCDHLLGVDVSEAALAKARERCAALPQVAFARLQIPEDEPEGIFDLLVVSEVAYYWSRADLEKAMELLAAHHRRGGHLVLVHWTPPVHDYPQTGDGVHNIWTARPEWSVVQDLTRERYRLSVLQRR